MVASYFFFQIKNDLIWERCWSKFFFLIQRIIFKTSIFESQFLIKNLFGKIVSCRISILKKKENNYVWLLITKIRLFLFLSFKKKTFCYHKPNLYPHSLDQMRIYVFLRRLDDDSLIVSSLFLNFTWLVISCTFKRGKN